MNTRVHDFSKNRMDFQGKPLVEGIGRGKAYLLKRVDLQRLRRDKQVVDMVSSEISRLDFAIDRCKAQISGFMNKGRNGVLEQSYPIFEATLLLLNDSTFISPVLKTMQRTGLKGQTVLAAQILKLRNKASGCVDELKAKSLITLQDLYYRLLYNMLPAEENRISLLRKIPTGSILVADRLTPVEIAVVPMDTVVGVIIEEGTLYSHAAIMARTLGVPVIVDLMGIGSLLDESFDLLIDAYRGYVFLNPSQADLLECSNVESRHKARLPAAFPGDKTTVCSADHLEFQLMCNASIPSDVQRANDQGITKVGLYRSEIRYLTTTVMPSAEQETAFYAEVFGIKGVDSITVRLLDLGGDKLPVFLQGDRETDPQLGCRGVRFLLSRADIMRKQLRAIFAARGVFHIRLLLPFITTIDDLLQARAIIDEFHKDSRGDFPDIGIMVEIPSVAMSIERFLPKVDFVCLGTNDLIQYFFAFNRDQTGLQNYNRFTHPAFLKLLEHVISACINHGTHLTVCGEMASDPLGCSLLAALGATNFSVQPDSIHHVRHALSKLDLTALQAALPTFFDLETADEVELKMQTLVI